MEHVKLHWFPMLFLLEKSLHILFHTLFVCNNASEIWEHSKSLCSSYTK